MAAYTPKENAIEKLRAGYTLFLKKPSFTLGKTPNENSSTNGYNHAPIPDGMPEYLEWQHDNAQWKYGNTNEAARESVKTQKTPGIESIFFGDKK